MAVVSAHPPRAQLLKMSEEEYHNLDAANWSTLKDFEHSAARVKRKREEPKVDTEAMKKGRFDHAALLEPARFVKRYGVIPDLNWSSNDKKAETVGNLFLYGIFGDGDNPTELLKLKKAELEARISNSAAKEWIEKESFEHTKKMSQAVWKHASAGNILRNATHLEHVVVWVDVETGVLCKGRIDCYDRQRGWLADFKSCQNACYGAFLKSDVEKRFYVCQMAHYRNGLIAAGYPVNACLWIAQEKSDDYATAVYAVSETGLSAGSEKVSQYLQMWAACKKTNYWPGLPEDIQDMDLSEYGYKRLEAK